MKSTCGDLDSFMEGQLGGARWAAFAHHLHTCSACRRRGHDLAQLAVRTDFTRRTSNLRAYLLGITLSLVVWSVGVSALAVFVGGACNEGPALVLPPDYAGPQLDLVWPGVFTHVDVALILDGPGFEDGPPPDSAPVDVSIADGD